MKCVLDNIMNKYKKNNVFSHSKTGIDGVLTVSFIVTVYLLLRLTSRMRLYLAILEKTNKLDSEMIVHFTLAHNSSYFSEFLFQLTVNVLKLWHNRKIV